MLTDFTQQHNVKAGESYDSVTIEMKKTMSSQASQSKDSDSTVVVRFE